MNGEGVRCSLRIAGPEFHPAIPECTRIFCEYPPYEFGEYRAFPEAHAAALVALEEKVRGLIDGQLYGPAFFQAALDSLDAAKAGGEDG